MSALSKSTYNTKSYAKDMIIYVGRRQDWYRLHYWCGVFESLGGELPKNINELLFKYEYDPIIADRLYKAIDQFTQEQEEQK